MDVASITAIGVVGTALFAMIFKQLQNLREDMKEGFRTSDNNTKAAIAALEDRVTGDVKALEHRVTGDVKALEHRVTGDVKALEDRVTGDVKAVNDDVKALELRVTGDIKAQGGRIDRVLDVLRVHGERLARIETKLDIDPPAEAA
ncbi:MAG: hypothetical protein OXT07_08760 [bacterium]|nr:hypothetical protein [bacterium]